MRDHKSPGSESSPDRTPNVPKSHDDRRTGLKPARSGEETALWNGVTVFGGPEAREKLETVVSRWKNLWNEKDSIVKIPKSAHMPIDLKPNWADHHKTNRVYPVGVKDQEFIDETFDKLHKQGKMEWSNSPTPFGYPVFVVWKTVIKDGKSVRKGRAVVDIRGLNQITQTDAYPMPAQTDIIAAVSGCSHISIVDAQGYFYQWAVREEDRYKQTVITHRGQEQFNVAVMGFKNSPAYVQRQTDLMLKDFRGFARTYIDDIVFFSMSLNEHVEHLDKGFQRLSEYDVTLSPKKSFLGYPSIVLLGQIVDAFGMTTSEEKLAAIAKLSFPRTLKDLETYLGMTGWMRNYVPFYAQISDPLQQRKTLLLRGGPTKGNPRRRFSSIKLLELPTDEEYEAYLILQDIFSKPSFLIHFAPGRWLLIDVDASKQRGFGAMVFHVRGDPGDADFKKSDIQPIMFLSKKLSAAEMKYWPTELEVAGVVWIVRKVRHLIESCRSPPVLIFTDHAATAGIVSQTSLTTTNTDKLNLRLVRASQFLSALPIKIKVKPGKLHIIPDALSRLESSAPSEETSILEDLDDMNLDAMIAMSIAKRNTPQWDVKSHHIHETLDAHLGEGITLIEMDEEFSTALEEAYDSDDQWRKIRAKLRARTDRLDTSDGIEFVLEGSQIYYAPGGTTPRLCIPWRLEKRIYALAHDSNHHCGFHRAYARIAGSLYIRHLAKRLRRYIKYCKKCMEGQTMRHAPYGELKPINTMALPFHTITIDFIVSMPETPDGMDAILSTTDKFSKRISLVAGKTTWSAPEWATPWLAMLQRESWGLPRAIISDRDPKFVAAFWKSTFNHLGIALLFTTAYHPQTDGQSERTNQTVEIALRYSLMEGDITDFSKLLPSIQATMNNSANASTGISPNEILYGFKVLEATDLLDNDLAKARADDGNPATIIEEERSRLRKEAEESISFAQTMAKLRYDPRHSSLELKEGDKVFIRLHRGYTQPGLKNRKFSKQRVGPITILEKIGRLAYKLDIPPTWRIHPVVSITHLEPVPPGEDPYGREAEEPGPVKTEGGDDADVYEVEKIIAKRRVYTGRGRRRRAHSEFRVKWTGWGDHHNRWMKREDLNNCQELLQEFEARNQA